MKLQAKLFGAFSSIIILIVIIGAYNIYQDTQIENISDTIRFELKPKLELLLEMRGAVLSLHIYIEDSLEIIRQIEENNSLQVPDENLQIQLEDALAEEILEIEEETEHFNAALLEYNELIKLHPSDEEHLTESINENFEKLGLLNSQIMESDVTYQTLQEAFSDFDKTSIDFVLEVDEATLHALHEIEELEESVEHTIQDGSSVTIILLAISIVLAIIIAILSVNSILRPVRALLKGSEQVSQGNFDYKIKSVGSDEQKLLIKSFNKMTESLSEKIEVEKQLAVKNEEMKNERINTIGELSSRIAHDIRNPLAVIKGILQLLEGKPENLSAREREQFDMINDSVSRISYQVDSVLDYVRKKPLQKSQNSVSKMIDEATAGLHIPEEFKILKENDIEIYCDARGMQVVFVNLIMNAIQAINGTGSITFRCSTNEHSTIQVEDSGAGIVTDNILKIFDPLFTTKQEGTGLGLASCKSIIEQHEGTIQYSNNPSTFTIKLPKNQS